MFKGFGSIFYKEIIQISRDPITLVLMLLIPMLQLTIFGYAINTDVRNIKTVVYNLDVGQRSTHVTNGALYPLTYDIANGFAPVALLAIIGLLRPPAPTTMAGS